jgi:uncharacterized membrane protein
MSATSTAVAGAPRVDVVHAAEHGDGARVRVELFSDAVFAVAITLLMLDLPVHAASGSLLEALADRWAAFAGFGISFAIIGCVWVSHFRLMRLVRHPDGALLFINLGLLMSVVLVPFGTSTMATFVMQPAAQSHLAAALFAAILVFMSVMFAVLHSLVAKRAGIVLPPARTLAQRFDRARPMLGGIVNAAGIAVAFISPPSVLCMTGGVAIFYVLDSQRNDRPC